MSGNTVHVNKFKDLTASVCGAVKNGLVSVSYSMNRNVNAIFAPGNPKATTYASLPDIEAVLTGYANGDIGGFDLSEANGFQRIDIHGKNGGVAVDFAVLTNISFNMTVDEPFTISKTYSGFSKPQGSSGGQSTLIPYVIKRADYTGSLPPGLEGNHLISVKGEIQINRSYVEQFATRKPYASVVNYPMTSSITYEVHSDSMDQIVIDDLEEACKNPKTPKYNVSIGACGIVFPVSKAYITGIEYGGADAGSQDFQTISVTYTSYESIEGIEPVIILDEKLTSC